MIDDVAGAGEKLYSPRRPDGLTAIKANRLTDRAIKAGWLKGQRWPTEATPADLQEKQANGALTMKEQAAVAVLLELTQSPDAFTDPRHKIMARRLRMMAANIVCSMESQNQADDMAELRAMMMGEQAKGLSADVLASVLAEVGRHVESVVGETRAREIVAELQERITVDTTTMGTLLTPDMEAAAMDATIPGPPSCES